MAVETRAKEDVAEKVVEKSRDKAHKVTEGEEKNQTVFEMARKVLLAGVGLAVLTQEETEKFVNRLVEKGEIAEKDGRKLLNDLMERRKKETHKAERNLDNTIDEAVERILNRMNIPSKADIENLSRRVITLSAKIDDLRSEREEGAEKSDVDALSRKVGRLAGKLEDIKETVVPAKKA